MKNRKKTTITVRNNAQSQRNIARIYRWLVITPEFDGRFYRNGDVVGFKTANYYNDLTFHFLTEVQP